MGKHHSKHRRPEPGRPAPLHQNSWQPRRPMSTQNDKATAEALRVEGNALFAKGKFAAAIEKYTEGLTLYPAPALLTNRAFCHKKRGDWPRVVDDSRAALALDPDHLKGNYYLGLGLREVNDLDPACHHLTKALELARSNQDSIKDEIWRELAAAKYARWEAAAAQRAADRDRLKARLTAALAALHQQEAQNAAQPAVQHEAGPSHANGLADGAIGNGLADGAKENAAAEEPAGNSHPDGAATAETQEQHSSEAAALEALFADAAQRDSPSDFNTAFACRLTLEPFREPAITPSGLSYERSALMNHLQQVGKFDPVTRERCTEAQVRFNLGLRAATQEYLDQNPWAWKDCI